MRIRAIFVVIVAGLSALAASVAAQKASKTKETQAQEAAKRGKSVYKEYCEICHYAEAEAMKMAPGLKGIYKKGKFADGRKVDDAAMRAWIEKGGPKMPPFRETLNDKQISDLIAYMRTL